MRRTAPVPTVNASASLLEDFSNGSAVRRSFICAANAKNIQTMNVQTGLDRSLNGQKREVMSSLQIADVTGRNHKEVMRSIRTMEPAWVKVNGRSFALIDYTDARGRKKPCYQLTKTECLYIATKFNDEARARLVLRWEELENQQRMEQSRELLDMMREVRALAKEVAALREQIGQGSRPAHRHEGFAEWQRQVKMVIRAEDKRAIAELYGCGVRHVQKVIAGTTVSFPLVRLISEYARDNFDKGVRVVPDRFDSIFTEAEMRGDLPLTFSEMPESEVVL